MVIIHFIFEVLPALLGRWKERFLEQARESLPIRLLRRIRLLLRQSLLCRLLLWIRRGLLWIWGLLQQLWRLFTESVLFRATRSAWRRLLELWQGSLVRQGLGLHRHEGRIYENSLLATGFDGLMLGITRLLRRALAPASESSVTAAHVRRILAAHPWLDFELLSGGAILLLLLFPSSVWRNIFALIIGLVLLAALLLLAAVQNRPALRLKTVGLPLLGFILATVVGVAVSPDIGEGVRVFCFFLASFLLWAVMAGSLTDERRLRKMLAVIYIGVVAAAAVAVVQRLLGVEVNATLTDLDTNAGMPGRVFSVYENPNNYAEIIVLLLPVAAVWAATLKGKNQRICACAGLLLPVAALLMTYSRSCWVGFALTVVVFMFFCNKKVLPVFLLLALLAVPLLPQTIWNRILTIGSTRDTSNMYRIYIWRGVLRMLQDWGVIGVGLGPENFRPVYLLYCDPLATPAPHSHMVYLEVWVEMGILGIGSYLAYYFTTIRNAVVRFTQATETVRLVLIAGVSSLIGIAFVSAAEYIWYYPRVMFCFFILTGIMAACVSMTDARCQAEACGKLNGKT